MSKQPEQETDRSPATLLDGGSGRRFGIGARIYLGLFGSVALVGLVSGLAYFYLSTIVASQSRLAEHSIPDLHGMMEVARESVGMVNASAPMASANSQPERKQMYAEFMIRRDLLLNLMEELRDRKAFGEETAVPELLNQLDAVLDSVFDSTRRRLEIQQQLELLTAELDDTVRSVENITTAALTGRESVAQSTAPEDRESALVLNPTLTELTRFASTAELYLGQALLLEGLEQLEIGQTRYEAATASLDALLQQLESQTLPQLPLLNSRLEVTGTGPSGILALRREQIERQQLESDAPRAGSQTANTLLSELGILAGQVKTEAEAINQRTRDSASNGIVVLIPVSLLSIAGAVLIGWFIVERSLLSRLVVPTGSMRALAGGDLKVPVAVSGNDEASDMAMALEVFRQNALEVECLISLQELTQEIGAKNRDLQHALEQIVAEEKLASPGQVAGGVAHEIKNPLNFIKNFNEISLELVEEITVVMAESQGVDKVLSEDINEILSDMRTNQGKVSEHSQRADGFVRSMLEHSRGKGDESRETDLNALLKQYRDLAYHASRAENTDFNIKEEKKWSPAFRH